MFSYTSFPAVTYLLQEFYILLYFYSPFFPFLPVPGEDYNNFGGRRGYPGRDLFPIAQNLDAFYSLRG